MTDDRPFSEPPAPVRPGDLVADLRTTIDRMLSPVERELAVWDNDMSRVVAGPTWTPLLRARLAELRATVERCRELGEAMTSVAARSTETPASETLTTAPTSEEAPG